jgi:hypothetical protein
LPQHCKCSGAGEKLDQLQKIFSYGSGPMIQLGKGGNNEVGWYIWGDPKVEEFIYVNQKLADRTNIKDDGSKNDAAEMLMVFNVFWHEAIHYLDFCVDGINQDANTPKGQPDIADKAEKQKSTFGFDIQSRSEIRKMMENASHDYGHGGKETTYGIFNDFRSGKINEFLKAGTKQILPGKYVPIRFSNIKVPNNIAKPKVTSYQNARFLD